MGSSIFLQSAFCQLLPCSIYCSPVLLPSHRKVARKKRATVVAALRDSGPFQRRVFLFMGFSFLPILQLREVSAKEAMEEPDLGASGPSAKGNETTAQSLIEAEHDSDAQGTRASELDVSAEGSMINEQETLLKFPELSKREAIQTASKRTVLAYLNGIGIIASCVVATLFAASQKEKKALESTIDSMKAQLRDKDTAATFLRETFESRLSQQEDELKGQLRRLDEEKISLSSELTSAKDALSALDRQLQVEKKLGEELKALRDQLEHSVKQAREGEKMLEDDCNQEFLATAMKELEETRIAYKEAISKISKMEEEYHQARMLLNSNLDEAKAASTILSNELKLAKELVGSTEKELVSSSSELKAAIEERGSLKKELVDTYKRVEITANDLKEESKLVANLTKELDASHKQVLQGSEARKILEDDLDKATRSLDEMKKSTILLSKEVDYATSRSVSLEAEREMLYKSLVEERNVAKEAKEDIEDAQNLITRLGGERENLEKRSKRLEEELAAAKGEILRLRRQISKAQESVNDRPSKANEAPADTPFSAGGIGRRRRKKTSSSHVS